MALAARVSAPDPAAGRRWAVASLLFAASLINYLDRASLSLALPVIGVDLHLDPTGKGLLLSAFFWSYAFMQVPVGICVDRFPIRWVYAGMFALWSMACGFTGFVGSLTTFLVLRVLLGIGEAVYFPGGTKLVYLLFPPKSRGLPSGIFNSGTRLGFALGGLIVPSLIVAFGWRAMFASQEEPLVERIGPERSCYTTGFLLHNLMIPANASRATAPSEEGSGTGVMVPASVP